MVTLLGEYLRETGMKQSEFASLVGAPPPCVSTWARGLRKPGRDSALAIELATGGRVPASYWGTVAVVRARRRRVHQ